jgi:hypothetical protein
MAARRARIPKHTAKPLIQTQIIEKVAAERKSFGSRAGFRPMAQMSTGIAGIMSKDPAGHHDNDFFMESRFK